MDMGEISMNKILRKNGLALRTAGKTGGGLYPEPLPQTRPRQCVCRQRRRYGHMGEKNSGRLALRPVKAGLAVPMLYAEYLDSAALPARAYIPMGAGQ